MPSVAEIEQSWEIDSVIDKTNIRDESLKISHLRWKYQKMWRLARAEARKLSGDLKRLRLDKKEFYTSGGTKETRARGWRQAPQGILDKKNATDYVEADLDVLALNDRLGDAEDAVTLAEEILKTLHQRSFHIAHALGMEKFLAGLDK